MKHGYIELRDRSYIGTLIYCGLSKSNARDAYYEYGDEFAAWRPYLLVDGEEVNAEKFFEEDD